MNEAGANSRDSERGGRPGNQRVEGAAVACFGGVGLSIPSFPLLRNLLEFLLMVIALLLALSPSFAVERPAGSAEAQTARYFENVRKDPNLLVAFLLEMPKGGDLHVHLSGAIYAETLISGLKTSTPVLIRKRFR
jgi:hypothetical protein